MDILEHADIQTWAGPFTAALSEEVMCALESGRVLLLPHLRFGLCPAEHRFLTPQWLQGNAKNISFDPSTAMLSGTSCAGMDREDLAAMMQRFAAQSGALVEALVPAFAKQLSRERTSFRPAEISGRAATWRSDDTRLHVDAFPYRRNAQFQAKCPQTRIMFPSGRGLGVFHRYRSACGSIRPARPGTDIPIAG